MFWKKLLLGLLVGVVVLAGAFVVWGLTPSGPMPEALAAMQSDAQVQVDDGSWLVFRPAAGEVKTGFIFYPGGRVDYRSYAPAAREIARQGYMVVIVPVPLSLAVLSPEKAAQVIEAYPDISRWAIGGHSLGGAMAARYARLHPDQISGLVLWASYPAESDSLAGQRLAVTSIYGTQDRVADPAVLDASHALLPAETSWVPIEGGNHAQFGWYGPQQGDGQALLGRLEQQEQAVSATVNLLAQIQDMQK